MTKASTKRVAFISSFPPRKCGIATFTTDLIRKVTSAAKGRFQPLVVAVRSDNDLKYDDPVKFEIRQNVKSDYICAADYINFSNVDLVSVQHEFGLFGGSAGSYLGLLLNRLNPPVITTLHTVLNEPAPSYYESMVDVCNASYRVVTMNERGVDMLRDIYGASGKKVELIPHGIPDLPFVDSNYYKHKFGVEGRRTVLTFGLLSRNKGIEVMLKAMPAIIKVDPSVLYIVLGMTHPNVLKHEGESYRLSLQRMVKDLGLQEHVVFHNRFVNDEELHNFLCAADVYVTPYLNREQLTSGTLSFAVGTGKAVVSTPYWAAMELLADGRGRLTKFGDSAQLAEAIIDILQNDTLFYSLRRRAYDYGRSRTWPKVGQAYWKLFTAKGMPIRVAARAAPSVAQTASSIEVPEPSLVHMKRLTDDTGLFQHAKFTVPWRDFGYTTDDNARALIAVSKYYAQYPEPDALRLLDTYLSFVINAQNHDGTVRNFMHFNRTWQRNEPENDALGRALWALGTLMAKPPSPSYLSVVKESFDRAVRHIARQYPRGKAYSILGMSDYLRQFPGASDIKRQLEIAADSLLALYNQNNQPDWAWFDEVLTYDNAVLPHALFVAGMTLESNTYQEVAEKSCEFLLANTFDGDHFSFIGCNGWYERGRTRASFDQQPLEAGGAVMMLRSAYDATGNIGYLTLQRKAFDWFLGENDLHLPLYDFRTKGCSDGLMAGGVNLNQGAESMVSFLQSLLAIRESYTMMSKVEEVKQSTLEGGNSKPTGKSISIRSLWGRTNLQESPIEEPA
ncbi:MAG TPA: glycosyltransferase family 4 protein [Sedimentisphaerales bacterium]|nr:glycosyltransferase family 4 protein [Sedimentisphaerales bacterium]